MTSCGKRQSEGVSNQRGGDNDRIQPYLRTVPYQRASVEASDDLRCGHRDSSECKTGGIGVCLRKQQRPEPRREKREQCRST